MPSSDSSTLREDIVQGWKSELFSPDTVVAVVAVVVAAPAGIAAAVLVDPVAIYAVLFATAAGPNAGYRRGEYADVDNRTAAWVGAAVALAVAVVTTAALAVGFVANLGASVAMIASGVVGLVFADVASRLAFDRVADDE